MKIKILFALGMLLMLSFSCKKDNGNDPNPISYGTLTDIDGNVYKTVTIGTQTWMAENLKTTKYRNGITIPNVTNGTVWGNLTTGAQCSYNFDLTISNKYGKLYNWYAVNDSRKIAPVGWHVASHAEWATLENYVAANHGNSGSVAKALASKTDWATANDAGAIGNDLAKNNYSGFSALPGGNRLFNGESFDGLGRDAYWWTSDPTWELDMNCRNSDVFRNNYSPSFGFSVRCIKDN